MAIARTIGLPAINHGRSIFATASMCVQWPRSAPRSAPDYHPISQQSAKLAQDHPAGWMSCT